MRKLLLATACLAALASPALAQPPGLWDHNGSVMRLVYNNGHFGVYYEVVRPGLVQTIPPGSPRFEGQRVGNQIIGNAFVYTQYCPGARFPYHVEGTAYNGTIELFGSAAVVDPDICAIVGYKPDSDNAHIVFRLVQPVAAVEPPVVTLPPPQDDPLPEPPAGTVPPPLHACPILGDCQPRTQAERREELQRQGREFCRQYPRDPVCGEPNK